MKILKATEVIFRRQVILSKTGIMTEKNVDLQIQYSVLEQLGPGVFSNSATHFYEHSLGFESDHLTSLLKIVTMEYLRLRLKTWKEVHRYDSPQESAFIKTRADKDHPFQESINHYERTFVKIDVHIIYTNSTHTSLFPSYIICKKQQLFF